MRGAAAVLSLLAMATLAGPAEAALLVEVDKDAQTMTVSVDGQTRYTWPVSTGVEGYDTPSGDYRPFRMEASHFSKEFDDAPMPHAIFFSRIGHAIHGTNQTRRLGRAASHGCVRLAPRNAATLFALVKAQKMANTRVVVTGAGEAPARDGLAARGGRLEDGIAPAGARWGIAEPGERALRRAGRDPFDPDADAYATRRAWYGYR